MTQNLGEFNIPIRALLDEFDQQMQSVKQRMQRTGQDLSKVGRNMSMKVTAPIVGLGAAAFASANQVGQMADELLDLSDATGLSTDSLQEWRAVARRAGTDTDAVASATETLTRRMATGEDGSADMQRAMEALGVSMLDAEGNTRSMDDMMPELVKSLAQVEDETQRARMGNQLFGGSWSEIAPIVGLGADEIDNATRAARESGEVMGRDALEDADAFRESMDELKNEFGLMVREIGSEFIPVFQDTLLPLIRDQVMPLIERFAGFISNLAERFANLGPRMQTVILAVVGIVAAVGPLLVIVGTLITLAGTALGAIGALGGAFTLLLGPVGLIAIAIAGLITVGVLLVRNWDTVRDATVRTWNAIVNAVRGPVNTIIGFANAIIGAYEAVINAVGSAVNAIPSFDVPGWVPGIGGSSFGLPDIPNVSLPRIPALAAGGIVTRPTLAMIGEAGPEAVVPLGANVGGASVVIQGDVFGFNEFERRVAEAGLSIRRRGGDL